MPALTNLEVVLQINCHNTNKSEACYSYTPVEHLSGHLHMLAVVYHPGGVGKEKQQCFSRVTLGHEKVVAISHAEVSRQKSITVDFRKI